MVVRLPRHDLHREKCSRCGKVFLTVVDDEYWRSPPGKRPSRLCPTCKLEETKSFIGGLFEKKKQR